MTDEIERIDLANARSSLSRLIMRAAGGESFIITRYGKDTAIVTGTGNFTVSSVPTQVEHGAAAPTHRPAPEPLEVKGQAARDAILNAARRQKS